MENPGLARFLAVVVVVCGVVAMILGSGMTLVGLVDGRERHLVGWGMTVFAGGATVGSFGFLCLAIYAIASRMVKSSPPIPPKDRQKTEPIPEREQVFPETNAETREEAVARRIAEYEARKQK